MTDMPENAEFFASCPKHLETLVQEELETLGCRNVRQTVAGVYFTCPLKKLYEVCLGSRLANRILMPVVRGKAKTAAEIYELVFETPWESHFSASSTFVVTFVGTNNEITNTQFGAQKVKDAVVDRFMAKENCRPSINKDAPDVRLNVRLTKDQCIVSFDLSGESLHRRGYRKLQGAAPLKENLAAAVLIRAGWPAFLAEAREKSEKIALVDPMCGSGTLLIEGALMAAQIAPGLLRDKFGFERLSFHDAALWAGVIQAAKDHVLPTSSDHFPAFYGEDCDERVLTTAKANVIAARLENAVQLKVGKVANLQNVYLDQVSTGVLICNPPYGERLGEIEALRTDYRVLGQVVKARFQGWQVAVLTSNKSLAKEMRLRADSRYKFFNGTIPAELITFPILAGQGTLREDVDPSKEALSEGAQMVANRLKKNKRKLDPWIKRNKISCYRLYDADMPEYSAAIDVYDDYFHVQEYKAPKNIDESKASKRFSEIVHAVIQTFDVPAEQVVSKTRMRHRGSSQYQRLSDSSEIAFMRVKEGAATLLVNLTNYLDSGVFLDHRPLRLELYQTAKNKRFLNLFCYTATATVHAALGGAASSVSVDLSKTYLDWAAQNLEENNISASRHQLVRSDVVTWLNNCRQGFDVIMLDPPSFSNSKKTDTVLDVQKDHVALIRRCLEILAPGGVLYFSNNLRSFTLDEAALQDAKVENITAQTLDKDYQRNTKIHQCWKIQHDK